LRRTVLVLVVGSAESAIPAPLKSFLGVSWPRSGPGKLFQFKGPHNRESWAFSYRKSRTILAGGNR
jgi:hypothetical protein